MITLSKNECRIVDFLIRHFNSHYTIRNIAKELKISPAGAQKSLKKLESEKIVIPERIGTAVVYSVDFHNKVAKHLSTFILSQDFTEKIPDELSKIKKYALLAIRLEKEILLISTIGNTSRIRELSSNLIEYNPVIQLIDEFNKNLAGFDKKIIEFIRSGTILWGEYHLVRSIKDRGIP